jgi:hypothetical protein
MDNIFPICQHLKLYMNCIILFCNWALRANDLPPNPQLYGFSPVWTRMCCLRWWFCANDLLQNGQSLSFSSVLSVWTFTCLLSLSLCAKDLSHNVQLNGFSPVWVLICLSSLSLLPKILLHCWQFNNVVLLTAGIFCSIAASAFPFSLSCLFLKKIEPF